MEVFITRARASAKSRLKIEKVLRIPYRLVTESASLNDQKTLCSWVVQLLKKLTDMIYQFRHARNYQRMRKVLDFIETHWTAPLAVEEKPREVCLSASWLSDII